VEIYSIDEAFLDLSGLEQHLTPYLGSIETLARRIRAGVKARTGIPVCVGVAPTKTLAKLANRLAKKDAGLGGVLYLDSAERRAWALGQVPAGDVWGVGRQYAQKLTAADIDLGRRPGPGVGCLGPEILGRGRRGAAGVGAARAALHPSKGGTLHRQSISCSRTFGRPLAAFEDVLAAVTAFLSRAAEKLRRQHDTAHVLTVYISKNRFAPNVLPLFSRSATLTLPVGPTADTRVLLSYARALLGRLWEPGTMYHKAGVVLDGLEGVARDTVIKGFDIG